VTINNPVLLGRDAAVAQKISSIVKGEINRSVSYSIG
jgi:hypothetical protein